MPLRVPGALVFGPARSSPGSAVVAPPIVAGPPPGQPSSGCSGGRRGWSAWLPAVVIGRPGPARPVPPLGRVRPRRARAARPPGDGRPGAVPAAAIARARPGRSSAEAPTDPQPIDLTQGSLGLALQLDLRETAAGGPPAWVAPRPQIGRRHRRPLHPDAGPARSWPRPAPAGFPSADRGLSGRYARRDGRPDPPDLRGPGRARRARPGGAGRPLPLLRAVRAADVRRRLRRAVPPARGARDGPPVAAHARLAHPAGRARRSTRPSRRSRTSSRCSRSTTCSARTTCGPGPTGSPRGFRPAPRCAGPCELKIDGTAINCVYRNGTLAVGATRGTGRGGRDGHPAAAHARRRALPPGRRRPARRDRGAGRGVLPGRPPSSG